MMRANPNARRLAPAGDILLLAALATLVGLTAWLSLTLARVPGSVAAVWIGNGIWVGWLLSRPTAAWPGYVVAGFVVEGVVRLLAGYPPATAAGLASCNLLEVLLVAGNVRRQVPDVGDPGGWLRLGRIATGTTLLACAGSGLLAAFVTTTPGGPGFGANFVTWYAAHVVGMVIVATLTLVVHREGWELFRATRRGWSFPGSMALIAAVGVLVFYQSSYPLLFLAFPPLLWAAFQHRFAGIVVGIPVLAVIATVATALGRGPLQLAASSGHFERALLVQGFIATACLLTFPVALAMAERVRLMARMRQSEARYRLLADYAHDVVVRMRPDGQRLYVSPSVRTTLGWEPEELLAMRESLAHPDDAALQQQTIAEVLASGEPITATYRLRHKRGSHVWIEAIARPVPSIDQPGEVDIIFAGRDVSIRMAALQALEATQRELENLARTDALTGLANRRQFEERLALALTRLRRHGLPVALLYLDIDHFKHINDRHGHGGGDVVLRTLAQRLSASVRGGDLAARLGGDEFVVLVEDAALPEAAETIARKLVAAMDQPVAVDGGSLRATTSIGIAYATRAIGAEALMATADRALYAAKEAGRNTWRMAAADDATAPGANPRSPAA
jgi:diguanylate cyclase (GGDEF)-like protein/PAS domain S-box-containing protein